VIVLFASVVDIDADDVGFCYGGDDGYGDVVDCYDDDGSAALDSKARSVNVASESIGSSICSPCSVSFPKSKKKEKERREEKRVMN